MARTINSMRKNLNLIQFFRLAKTVATDYATSAASTARTVLMERYCIGESTFYSLLDLSITHHLVSEKLVKDIFDKKLANQLANGNHGYSSGSKYNKLLKERKNYSAFSKKDIAYIAKYYAEHPELSKEETAKLFSFESTKVLSAILKKACLELIITDKVVKQLHTRAIASATDVAYTEDFFASIFEYRKKAKKSQKKSAF